MTIAEKVILITGAGSGIGRAMAVAFGQEGARVICCGRRQARLEETAHLVASQGGIARALPVDVTQSWQVEEAVADVVREFGRLDVLVNNAARFGALGSAFGMSWNLERRDGSDAFFPASEGSDPRAANSNDDRGYALHGRLIGN